MQPRAMVALGILLVCSSWSLALDPSLDVSQYSHRAWRISEGFAKGEITSVVQTPDGYIWVGTGFGVLRFDGVKTSPLELPQNQHLPSTRIYSLLASRDGTLWIGTFKGLSSWKEGQLTEYAEFAGQTIFALVEDHEGTVWVGSVGFPPPGRLCSIQNGRVHCVGQDGSLGEGVLKLLEDTKGNLWAANNTGVWRWKPGPREYYPLPDGPKGMVGLAQGSDGAILVSTRRAIQRLADGKIGMYPLPGTGQRLEAKRLLCDRDGGLWIGTAERGILHVHAGRTDVFASSDGLSGDDVNNLFEDREGNVWVATRNGLDCFRNFAVTTFTANQGLSNTVVNSIVADSVGSVWLATFAGLDRWDRGKIATYDQRSGKLNGLGPNYIFQDRSGRIWVSTNREFGYLENHRFVPVSVFPPGVVVSMAEDSRGNLWIANQDFGLIRLRDGSVIQRIPWAGLGRSDPVSILGADPLHGGLWLGFFHGGVAYFEEDKIRASYTAADGLGEGRVNDLGLDPDGTLWAATEGGLSRLKNGRISTLTSKNGLPCDAVHWMIEDNDHSFWLYMPCGLVRIARSEMDAWAAAADQDTNTRHNVQGTIFDSSNGVRTIPTVGLGSQVAKSPDGKLWFLPWDGVSVIDPKHLPFNTMPPPVHIEQVIADHTTHDATLAASGKMQLPALVRDLEIDYTALSFVAPDKVLFRYKLEGSDRDWHQVGPRRQAFYTNLPPRHYRFRVVACNNSGVWNEQGAALDFSIAPAYYQTAWFQALCVFVFLALLWSVYQLRQRQVQQQFNMRLETRVNERTRIARELHDTLLQNLHGLLYQFQAARNTFAKNREKAMQALDEAIHGTRQAIVDSRSAIQDLRSELLGGKDLAEALTAMGQELAASHEGPHATPMFRMIVEGERRNLSPALQDDIYKIAREVLRNAFTHAQAQRIETEIRYDVHEFRLRIRDDGKGISPAVLAKGGAAGHWGLSGIRERAQQIGAQLHVWSETDVGTEVQFTIPGSVAYETPRNGSGFRLFRKVRSHEQ